MSQITADFTVVELEIVINLRRIRSSLRCPSKSKIWMDIQYAFLSILEMMWLLSPSCLNTKDFLTETFELQFHLQLPREHLITKPTHYQCLCTVLQYLILTFTKTFSDDVDIFCSRDLTYSWPSQNRDIGQKTPSLLSCLYRWRNKLFHLHCTSRSTIQINMRDSCQKLLKLRRVRTTCSLKKNISFSYLQNIQRGSSELHYIHLYSKFYYFLLHVVDTSTGYHETAIASSRLTKLMSSLLKRLWIYCRETPVSFSADTKSTQAIMKRFLSDHSINLSARPVWRHNKTVIIESNNHMLKNIVERLQHYSTSASNETFLSRTTFLSNIFLAPKYWALSN